MLHLALLGLGAYKKAIAILSTGILDVALRAKFNCPYRYRIYGLGHLRRLYLMLST